MTSPTLTNNELREKIAEDIRQYLKKGGKITQCPPSSYSDGRSIEKVIFDNEFKGRRGK